MKKGMKILSFALIVMMVLSMTMVFAEGSFSDGAEALAGEAEGSTVAFGPLEVDDRIKDSGAGGTVSMILGAMQWIGYAIAVGMLIYIGIKYVMASADEKANLKNSLVRYVIGAVLIAGGVTIAGWIFGAFAQ